MYGARDFVKSVLEEDIGRGDLFSLAFEENKRISAVVLSKDFGILSGVMYVSELCDLVGIDASFYFKDGDEVAPLDEVMLLKGDAKKILSAERSILNIIQHSSGISTKAKELRSRIGNVGVRLLDTRKTRPLLRVFEKYSVRNGGVTNHRFGIDDCLMLKDTHLAVIDNLESFINRAKKKLPWTHKIEVEVSSVEMAKIVMKIGVDVVMCDNMEINKINSVVSFRNTNYPNILLEASGNINEDNVAHYANTGVDAISVGSVIHKAVWLDFSMNVCSTSKEIEPKP